MENIVAQILEMVQNILSFTNEGEAAGIIAIVKEYLTPILAMLGL